MALLLVSAGIKAGKKAYKAYDNKQKDKKEKELKDNQGQDAPDLSRLALNDPSYPALSITSQIVPQEYVDEKKSREYEDHKDSNLTENPFEAPPPSYQTALEQPSSAPSPAAYGGGFGPSEYTPRRRGSTSSSISSSSSSSDSESKRYGGMGGGFGGGPARIGGLGGGPVSVGGLGGGPVRVGGLGGGPVRIGGLGGGPFGKGGMSGGPGRGRGL
ncbi:hypothetical protein I204_06573 [Kwoniella mangroviensis CBS 8886]|nr:hypothetical protein I204_06573 [Kwoniella mangroviensis CBS 8886]